jgi:hypothetical protein
MGRSTHRTLKEQARQNEAAYRTNEAAFIAGARAALEAAKGKAHRLGFADSFVRVEDIDELLKGLDE